MKFDPHKYIYNVDKEAYLEIVEQCVFPELDKAMIYYDNNGSDDELMSLDGEIKEYIREFALRRIMNNECNTLSARCKDVTIEQLIEHYKNESYVYALVMI